MARAKSGKVKAAGGGNGANLGFEDGLWKAADALRSNMDAAEYKHIVVGLNFLNFCAPVAPSTLGVSSRRVVTLARRESRTKANLLRRRWRVARLREQMKESATLDTLIWAF